MRGSLVLRGGPLVPDLNVARDKGIQEFAWEAVDPQLSKTLLESIRRQAIKVRVMRDPSWNGLSAVAAGAALSDDITRLGGGEVGTSAAQLAAMLDAEVHDSRYVITAIRRFRELRSGRHLIWTCEPLQGGWFSPELVQLINDDPLLAVAPQTYYGDMRCVYVELVVNDLLQRGVKREKIVPFLRADRLDVGWDGYAFDHSNIR